MALYHYIQANGAFHEVRANGDKLLGVGYAGYGRGVNQPALDTVRSVGPIPDGVYFRWKTERSCDPRSLRHPPYPLQFDADARALRLLHPRRQLSSKSVRFPWMHHPRPTHPRPCDRR